MLMQVQQTVKHITVKNVIKCILFTCLIIHILGLNCENVLMHILHFHNLSSKIIINCLTSDMTLIFHCMENKKTIEKVILLLF